MKLVTSIEAWVTGQVAHPVVFALVVGLVFGTVIFPEIWRVIRPRLNKDNALIEALHAHAEALRVQTGELRRHNDYRDRDKTIKAFREKRAAQGKLPDERQLNNVLFWIARKSAWGRWQYAQMSVSPGTFPSDWLQMQTAAMALQMKAETGELPIIARRRNHAEPEPVSPDLLKNIAYLQSDSRRVWKVSIQPRSGLDTETINKIPDYVSLEADWARVEELWPEHDAFLDDLTAKLRADKKDE